MEQTVDVSQDIDLISKGSELCVECGLCCQGFLHPYALVYDDEVDFVKALDLEPYTDERVPDEKLFRLPCHHHKNGCCSIYPNRPRVCGEYKCNVLLRFLDQGASFEKSQTLVRTAVHLVEAIQTHIGSSGSKKST